MMDSVAVHRRQFVLGPMRVEPVDGWCHLRVDDRFWLSHCPRLPVVQATDLDGRTWTLLGLAEQTLAEAPDPTESLEGCRSADVAAETDTWAGRWVLLGGGEIHLDASGLLGCFYELRPSGGLVVSSSEVLLPDDATRAAVVDSRRLVHGRTIPFYPPPAARRQGVARLLPSQVLNLMTGQVQPRALIPKIKTRVDSSGRSRGILDALGEPMLRLNRRTDRLWLSLSGGGDSRVILSAAIAAGISLRTYTRVTQRMSAADFFLPPEIAARFDLSHQYFDEGRRIAGRWALAQTHSGGHVSRGDAAPLLRGGRDSLEGISVGGHGFGFAKKLRRGEVGADPSAPLDRAKEFAACRGEPPTSSAVAAFERWVEWVRDQPCPGIDLRDRYYLEQSHAGWQSSKEQLYDMGLHERFFPLNCRRTHALVLEHARSYEPGNAFEFPLMEASDPALLDWPCNPPDATFGWFRTLAARTRRDPMHPPRQALARIEGLAQRVGLRINRD